MRLVPAYLVDDDSADDPEGRVGRLRARPGPRARDVRARAATEAAERWSAGDVRPGHRDGPHAPGRCATCGFYLPLAGLAAGAVRRLRQRLRPGRRPRGHRRLRLRRAQPGDAGAPRTTPRSSTPPRYDTSEYDVLDGLARSQAVARGGRAGPAGASRPGRGRPGRSPATQVHVQSRSTRSPSSSRTTSATAQSAVPTSTTRAVSTCSGGGAGFVGRGHRPTVEPARLCAGWTAPVARWRGPTAAVPESPHARHVAHAAPRPPAARPDRGRGPRTGWTATSRSARARLDRGPRAARRADARSSRWPTSWCSTRSSCRAPDITKHTLPFAVRRRRDGAGRRRDDDPDGRRRQATRSRWPPGWASTRSSRSTPPPR